MKVIKTEKGYNIQIETGIIEAKDKPEAKLFLNELMKIDLQKVSDKYDKANKELED